MKYQAQTEFSQELLSLSKEHDPMERIVKQTAMRLISDMPLNVLKNLFAVEILDPESDHGKAILNGEIKDPLDKSSVLRRLRDNQTLRVTVVHTTHEFPTNTLEYIDYKKRM